MGVCNALHYIHLLAANANQLPFRATSVQLIYVSLLHSCLIEELSTLKRTLKES